MYKYGILILAFHVALANEGISGSAILLICCIPVLLGIVSIFIFGVLIGVFLRY